MNALSWLNDLIRWFGRWVPRLTLVPPTHRGVRFGPKGGATEVGPGVVLWWPIVQQLLKVPVTTQSIETSCRILPLDDGRDDRILPRVVVCGLAIQYRVEDAVKAAVNALNLHALIDNRAQAALGQHWDGDISKAIGAVDSARRAMSEGLRSRYGVLLEEMDVTQLGVGIGLKQLSDWSYTDRDDGQRPGEDEQ